MIDDDVTCVRCGMWFSEFDGYHNHLSACEGRPPEGSLRDTFLFTPSNNLDYYTDLGQDENAQ